MTRSPQVDPKLEAAAPRFVSRWVARLGLDALLLKNIGFTAALQIGNYAAALLTVPYLTRVLGVSGYGMVSFVIGVMSYVWLIIDWGFSMSGAREAARLRDDPTALSALFWRVTAAKSLLAACATAFVVAAAAFGHVENPVWVIAPGMMAVVATVMNADWFARGLERMGAFASLSLGARIAALLLIFLLVHKPADAGLAVMLHGVGGLSGSLGGLVIAATWGRVGAPRIDWRAGARQIWDDRHYMLLNCTAFAYIAGAPIVLNLTSGAYAVGLFAGVDKIVRVLMTVMNPVNTAVYPRINALIVRDRPAAARLAGRVLALQTATGLAIGAGLLLLGEPVTVLVLGPRFAEAAATLRILAFVPMFSAVSGALSAHFLIALGHKKILSRISIVASLLYLVALVAIGWRLGAPGAACALLAAEVFIVGAMVAALWRSEPEFLRQAIGFLKPNRGIPPPRDPR